MRSNGIRQIGFSANLGREKRVSRSSIDAVEKFIHDLPNVVVGSIATGVSKPGISTQRVSDRGK